MSHRKHAARREVKEALRDPDADKAARIEALLQQATIPLVLPATEDDNDSRANGAPLESPL